MILIAIGANLTGEDGSTPIDTCRAAVPFLCEIPGLSFVALSNWYRTPPQPRANQPDYCNGAIRFFGEITPADLLARLHEIEARFGRQRAELNAARTLDLDIIDLNGIIRATPDPILPHPRAHLRAFVLLPLRDVAPGWVHPRSGQAIDALIAALPPQDVAVLAD